MSNFLDFIKNEPNVEIMEQDIKDIQNTEDTDNTEDTEDTEDTDDTENIEIVENIENIEIVEPIEIVISKKPIKKEKFSFTRNEDNKYKIKTVEHPNNNNFTEFFLKKGDRVKIVRTERKYKVDDSGQLVILEKGTRLCDVYCGYIGEIRQFFKGNDRAIVTLYAPNNLPHIDFHIDCLEKLDN